MDKVFVTQADIIRQLDRAIDRIMSVEIEAMNGDNLAVTLCSYFEDADDTSEPDDNGWSQSATDAYDEIKQEIAGLFVPVREIVASLAAQQQVEPVTVWQPIETAPKDGSYVDLWCAPISDGGAVLLPCRLPNCYWVSDYNSWYMSVARGELIKVWHRVTHWMPLPAAPEKDV